MAYSTDASTGTGLVRIWRLVTASMAGIHKVYTVVARSSFFFLGGEVKGRGKIHIHEVICDDNDDDDVWHIEALRKTNLIGGEEGATQMQCGQERDHDDICQWNDTLNTLISWIGCIRIWW